LPRPIKELKGFTKVSLKAGESKNVSISLDKRALKFYHPDQKAWVVEKGDFEIMVGVASNDIKLQAITKVQ